LSDTRSKADVIIVGGGIIGCSIAYRLAQEKLSVIVIERDRVGGEASGAAAGILGPQAEADSPDPFLDLCLASRSLYPSLAEELRSETGIDIEYLTDGLLYLAFTDEDEHELEARYRWQSSCGLRVERLSAREAREIEPRLSPEVRWALRFPDDHQVNNVKLTAALARGAIGRGARFLIGRPATKLVVENGRAVGVETPEERLSAAQVVNAAGSWSGQIDCSPAPQPPVSPVRGQMIAIETPQPVLRHVVYSSSCYLVPRIDGRLLIGSTMEHVGYNKKVTVEGIGGLLRGALEIIPSLNSYAFKEAWAGLRPYAPDKLPILGESQLPGLIIATAHFRNGILLTPITGQLIADLIISGKTSTPLERFSPNRFQ